jgi:uncharacterized protein involved in response to NO
MLRLPRPLAPISGPPTSHLPSPASTTMVPMSPQPAGLPSGTIGGRRRHAQAASARAGSAAGLCLRAGGLLLGGLLAWWLASLLRVAFGGQMHWAVAPGLAHALVLLAAPLPALLAGAALVALPRWSDHPALPAAAARLPVAGLVAGGLLAWTGSHGSLALMATGLALAAAGLALLTGRLALVWADGRRRPTAGLWLLLGLAALTLSIWAAAVALALGSPAAARAALAVALWAGVGPVVLMLALQGLQAALGERAGAAGPWSADGLLTGLVALLAMQAPLAAAAAASEQAWSASSGPVAGLRAAVGLAGGALLMWLALAQGLRSWLAAGPQPPAVAERRAALLLVLGLVWLSVSFTLEGMSQGLRWASEGRHSLGNAALHAYTQGVLGSWLLALAGAGLRRQAPAAAPAVDRWTWVLAWVLQAATLLRLLAELFPAAQTGLTLLAAQFAAVAALTWALRAWRAR